MTWESRRRREQSGRLAENLARLFLALKGYRLLARRFKCPAGEVDLICRRGRLVVFVEVKHRQKRDQAIEALLPHQIERVRRAGELFVAKHPKLLQFDHRIDAVLIAPGRWPRHLKGLTQ